MKDKEMIEEIEIIEKVIRSDDNAGAMVKLLNQEQAELQKARKDKEKQIEEIANMLSEDCGNCDICEYCGVGDNNVDCIAYYDANKIYNAGYRKLPKDSVVLSREEYESDLTLQYDIGYEFGSKETAEKIIDLIKTFCPDKKFIETITRIIAERFGVDIKE